MSTNEQDSDYFMNDSADIKTAANRLQTALSNLEESLSPLLEKVTRLERVAQEAESFKTDRSKEKKSVFYGLVKNSMIA